MQDSPDAVHLKAWCASRCEKSFRIIVQRHLGMVYALALRRLGNGTQAADVTQNVFLVLARKAGRLRHDAPLSPWLHRCTMIECADVIRRECRRVDAMKKYFEHVQNDAHPDADAWHEIVPHLDQAVDSLRSADRDVIVMRYYQRLNYGEIGAAMGKSAQAAQKQGERALERICETLRKRGVVAPVAVLASGLAASVRAAPVAEPALASLATRISSQAVASTTESTSLIQTLFDTLMTSKTRTALVTAAVAAIPLTWKWQQSASLAGEVEKLQQKVQALTPSAPGHAPGNGNGSRAVSTVSREKRPSSLRAGTEWEQALMEGDPIERHRRISDLIAKLTPESAPEVLAAFDRLSSTGLPFDSEKMLFLRAWGRLDGEAAMAALKGSADMPPGDGFACAALAGWAVKNPAAARAYIEAITDPQRKAALTYGLLDGWAAVDFEAAAAYAASSPRSSERDRFRELLLARAFSAGGIEGAQRYFAGIPADDHNQLYRQRAFEDVTRLLMMRDPAMARDWLSKQENQGLINSNVLSMNGTNDPQATLNWMDSLKGLDPKVASQAAAELLSGWAQSDPVAATAWMSSQNNRADRDALVSSMARVVGYAETEGAVKWAQTINDPEQRQRTLDSVIRRSLRRDPQGAPAELAALGITQEDIAQAQSRGGSGVSVVTRRGPDGSEETFTSIVEPSGAPPQPPLAMSIENGRATMSARPQETGAGLSEVIKTVSGSGGAKLFLSTTPAGTGSAGFTGAAAGGGGGIIAGTMPAPGVEGALSFKMINDDVE